MRFLLLKISVHDFNSIKVRLKPLLSVHIITESSFQFHKGTIKTWVFLLTCLSVPRFQFHKGTIKT